MGQQNQHYLKDKTEYRILFNTTSTKLILKNAHFSGKARHRLRKFIKR